MKPTRIITHEELPKAVEWIKANGGGYKEYLEYKKNKSLERYLWMKNKYRHGGNKTPQYYCFKCKHAHTRHSKIGKRHLKYERKWFPSPQKKL